MDDLDTPASPIADNNDWYPNEGAETPEHVEDPLDARPESPDANPRSPPLENAEAETPEHVFNGDERAPVDPTPDSPIQSPVGSPANRSDDEAKSPESEIKKRNAVIDSDSDSNAAKSPKDVDEPTAAESPEHEDNETQASKLMENIFGEDLDDEDSDVVQEGAIRERKQRVEISDDDERSAIRVRVEGGESDDDRPTHRWDFDEMMDRKKKERKRTKRRRRDGTYDLISDADDQIKDLVESMMRAANLDRQSNENRQPAFQKQKLLSLVRQTLLKADFFEALLDNGMMSAVSEWLAPLPDKSLPSLEVRTTLLKILCDFPNLEQGILRQSGLGKAVMYLLKHPREVKENKIRAAKLIREWSRPIFQLDSDYTSMSREERYERDTIQHNNRKRRRESEDEPQTSSSRANRSGGSTLNVDDSAGSLPGQMGFVPRARVPKPSMKAYVNRPTPAVEGRFAGPSKGRGSTRYDVAQREFKERTKTQKARRHIGVSIAGNKMEI